MFCMVGNSSYASARVFGGGGGAGGGRPFSRKRPLVYTDVTKKLMMSGSDGTR